MDKTMVFLRLICLIAVGLRPSVLQVFRGIYDKPSMKLTISLAVLMSILLASSSRAGQPLVGQFTIDLQTWRTDAARDPNLVTVNGAAMKLSPRDRAEAIDMVAKIIKDYSIEVRADGSFTLTFALGKVEGTWVMEGDRLVATPTVAKPAFASGTMNAKPFWLTHDTSGVRFHYDDQASHSLPLTATAE